MIREILKIYLQVQVEMIHPVTMLIFGRKMAVSHQEKDGFSQTALHAIQKLITYRASIYSTDPKDGIN